ncbi:MAG: alanyl-tRNA editing protein [Oscillospiraceae bacterium]|nr:alanyl-tRNA editing protein [Oscillospiraceae bacterium]
MTEKLYYYDGHLANFTAKVLSCTEENGRYAVVLDRTAFFPGGGGQDADEGELGGMRLLGLREDGEEIIHLVPGALQPGAEVGGKLDWPLRFGRMQGHSGEHILSGTVHRLFGCDNVGFHMGAEGMTIDFSAELSREDLSRAELEANRAIWRNLPVRTLLPGPEKLHAMEYRSKKELSGEVRIVEIEGVDRCACCAPHVSRTGEVGVLKIIDSMRHRGGTRLTLICGEAALRDYQELHANNARVSASLSAKRLETGAAIERHLAEQEERKAELTRLNRELLQLKAARLERTEGCICIFEEDMDMITLRELVNAGAELAGIACAGFTGRDGDYKYIIGSRTKALRSMTKEINAAIEGRGGGSDAMLQGTSRAGRETIERYFESLKN